MSQRGEAGLLHIVFSTHRQTRQIPVEVARGLHTELGSACAAYGARSYAVGGAPDHVHILCSPPPLLPIGHLVDEIKAASAAWLRSVDLSCARFAWQESFIAFAESRRRQEILQQTINSQKDHHARYSYRYELLDLLRKHAMTPEESVLWR